MDWSDFMNNLAQSTIESGVNAAYQFALSSGTYNKQKKLLQKQADLQNQFYGIQNARQDYLLANADLIRKHALDRAGYSTADPQGTGTTPSNAMQVPSVSTPGFSMPTINAASVRDLAQGDLMSAQAQLAESQSDYYETLKNKTSSETDLLNLEIQKFKDTYQIQVDKIMKEFDQLVANIALTQSQTSKYVAETGLATAQTGEVPERIKNLQAQREEIKATIEKFAAETANIRIDTKFNEATFDARKDTIIKELEKLGYETDQDKAKVIITNAQSKLAEMGILVGNGWLNSLISVAAMGRGDLVTKSMADFVKSATSQLTHDLPSVFGGIISQLFSFFVQHPDLLKRFLPGT